MAALARLRPSGAAKRAHADQFRFTPAPSAAMIAASNKQGTQRERHAMGGAIRNTSLLTMAALAGLLAFGSGVAAQTPASPPAANAAPSADNAVLLTIFLKHD